MSSPDPASPAPPAPATSAAFGPGGASRALLRRLAGGAALGAVLKFGGVGLAFLMLLVLARRMEADAYGVFAAAFSLATIAGFVATLGQHVAILRFWPSLDEAHGRAAAAAALRFSLGLTAAGAAVTAGALTLAGTLAPQLSVFGGTGLTLALTGAMAGAFALSETAVAGLRARGSMAFALGPREILWRLAVIAGAFALSAPLGADTALAVIAAALLAVTAPQLAVLAREAFAAPRTPAPAEDARAMRRSVFDFWGGGAVGPLTGHVGTILVGAVLGPVAAGAYFAADRIAKLLSIALIGVNQIVGPMIARSWRGDRIDEVRLLVFTGSVLAFAVAGAGFLAYLLFGRYALSLFNPAYADAFPILLILSAGQLVNTICGPNNFLLNMAGRERDYLVIMTMWGIAAIVGIWFGASQFGVLGAALASALAMTGWNISAVVTAQVRLGVSPFSFLKKSEKYLNVDKS